MRLFIMGAVLSLAVVVGTAALIVQVRHTPTLQAVKSAFQSSDRVILDRSGQAVDEVRVDKSRRRLNWMSLAEITPALSETIVQAEDKRFFYHPGFDPLALARAALSRLKGNSSRGASTISMQVAELLDQSAGPRSNRRGVKQKLAQIGKAIVLEITWSKVDILEAYINLITYRSELQGIAAASFGLFDKSPMGLTRPEAAVIAALIRAPNAKVPQVQGRACQLLARLNRPEECDLLTTEHLSYLEDGYKIRPYMRMAPHLSQRLVAFPELAQGSFIHSTLDRQIQWVALHALQNQISALQNQNMNDGAVVVLENHTGNVLAYVGNVGAKSTAHFVDAAVALRQAGSTLKPFIFARAIDERILTAASVLEDTPHAISVGSGMYRPTNFDRSFRNLVTVRSALASSLNIPAVRALELVGVETFVQTLLELGFSGLQRADIYGPSLALGSADVKLLDLTNAYRALANGGQWSPIKLSPQQLSESAAKAVFSPAAAFIITNILSDREARIATFGLESTLSTRYWTAVKTGTSKDMRDNWCIGFSEKYTVGVWTGNFSGEAMWSVSGVQGAAPVWQEVMNYLHLREPSQPPRAPEGLVQMNVNFDHKKAQAPEWFLLGTEPNQATIESKPDVRSHISYPLDQSTIALDPDIPRSNHRMLIQIVAPKTDQNLYLNGRRLGRAAAFLPWEPEAGKYTLELRDSKGRNLDRVKFEVRGQKVARAF